MISSYSTFLPEATCPQLRQVLTDNFTECATIQYNVFDRMNQLGWYQTRTCRRLKFKPHGRNFSS